MEMAAYSWVGSGASSLVVSLALETGEPVSTALELLEFGCGIIAGYTFDARNDVSELGKIYLTPSLSNSLVHSVPPNDRLF